MTQKTVSNNIKVLLLFGGFVTRVTRRHRLKPAEFDMGIFSCKQIEYYVMEFLKYLHEARGLAFSTIANYVNSLVCPLA